jgi:hypothetical protein
MKDLDRETLAADQPADGDEVVGTVLAMPVAVEAKMACGAAGESLQLEEPNMAGRWQGRGGGGDCWSPVRRRRCASSSFLHESGGWWVGPVRLCLGFRPCRGSI